MTKPTVCRYKVKTDTAHFKQARIYGTEVTNKFEIADTHERIACEAMDCGPTLGL